ncbi:MAG: hypothetical protein NXI27_19235 [Alphaproteobacteria bacterium]|nr:hypothetical protein [Alphaproteobacteria bacterium]
MHKTGFTSAVALAVIAMVSTSPALAQDDAAPQIAQCIKAVGTYLTQRENPTVTGPERVGRSLLSLTNGGHAFLTDSASGGVSGFQPFSDGRGVWRCQSAADGVETFSAMILDFTFPTDKFPDPLIARIDIEATVQAADNRLTGKTTIRFAPLAGDPMDETQLQNPIEYAFTGQRLTLPDAP